MAADREVIRQCFEELAHSSVDICQAVYGEFLVQMPEVNRHIGILDDRMRGRMLDQIFQLLMDDVEQDYLTFETHMHKGYGATTESYRSILAAVKHATSVELGESWSQDREESWNRAIDSIVGEIERSASTPGT